VLITEFAEYLRFERGLAPMTVGAYSSRAARFLARYAPDGDPAVITPGDVSAAVVAEASGKSASAGQYFACSLRAFLRYCHVRGLVGADVSAAALGVTGRRTTMLPRGLEPGQVEALLASCDRDEPVGKRDYAVILLLARLGLRAGEAARLRLDDVNWRAGEAGIRGKGGQYDVLPLPADVGAAIADWLRDGRPAAGFREVFTSVLAPTRPLTRENVGWIVRRACVRAGMPPFGAHRLRHNAACAMIGAKVPLAGIAQALRHRSHIVTAGYARAGIDRLRPLARPWPGTPALPQEGEAS
jgi:integrase